MRRRRLRKTVSVLALAAGLGGCALVSPLPDRTTLDDRLAVFPTRDLPLREEVVIHWNEQQVPFVEAQDDTDLAFTLGLVHAHLRLGQMEILRRISQGRLAEMGGPLATEIDHSLRILDYGRATDAILQAMPEENRAWLDAFVAGINHYQANVDDLPHEYALLGLPREPWSPGDVITIGRLASTDVNWLVWFRLMEQRDRADWPALWARLIEHGSDSAPSFVADTPPDLEPLMTVLGDVSRIGSNSVAVSGERSATGGALIASDPHLGLSLPNLWLLAGYRSPSYHAVGLMVPGLPFIAVGRNPWIAWGGTNMRSANSDLFDVSALPDEAFRARQENVTVRWWFDKEVTVRDTDYGPVISDAPVLDTGGTTVALRWIGHRPSDEMTAMLRVNAARNWDEFQAALTGFAISPQNMVYADVEGNVGMVMATHLPARAPDLPDDIVRPVEDAAAWDRIVTSAELPSTFNPPGGVIGSANNRPAPSEVPVGYFFSPSDRIDRIYALLGDDEAVDVDRLAALQQDVYMASAVALRDALVERAEAAGLFGRLSPELARPAELMRGWDGHYRAESEGALAFELIVHHFTMTLYEPRDLTAFDAVSRTFHILAEDVAAAPPERIAAALEEALRQAREPLEEYGTWGRMHRLRLGHSLAALPVIGHRYTFGNVPAAGSSATLMKTAHDLTDQQHHARYGSNSRHISDLADPDRNYFVLLGGQDGWLNSSTFLDQVDLWQRGDYIQLPLRTETVDTLFAHRMELRPGD